MSVADAPGVTVVNAEAWQGRSEQLARLLRATAPGGVIPDPVGAPAEPDGLATVTNPGFWANDPRTLADALSPEAPGHGPTPGGHAAGAVSAAPERLTLTVEEAGALLGISRAFAYEAVRRGEIPSIRIGRRVLVPRVALERLLSLPGATDPEPGE